MSITNKLLKKKALSCGNLNSHSDNMDKFGVGIIGMSCRFPGGSNSPAEYWDMMNAGKQCGRTIPTSLFDTCDIAHPYMASIDKPYHFDNLFFEISELEAIEMDHVMKHALELSYAAVKNAGLERTYMSSTATDVYFGVDGISAPRDLELSAFTASSSALSCVSGRVSYHLDLHGAAVSVSTACSSSTVAIMLGHDRILSGGAQMALVGGASIIDTPLTHRMFCQSNMLCKEPISRPFDADSNGYLRGEGGGVLLLKRQLKSLPCHAWIDGGSLGQNGHSASLTAPKGPAQERNMHSALNSCNLSVDAIDFIESGSPGTQLGDPIEAHAIRNVFGNRSKPMYITTVKRHIGHLETASGTASVIKVILALQNKVLPKTVAFEKLNPNIGINDSSIVIQTDETQLESSNSLRGMVSSFGFSGTIGHIILSESRNVAATQQSEQLFNNRKLYRRLETLSPVKPDKSEAKTLGKWSCIKNRREQIYKYVYSLLKSLNGVDIRENMDFASIGMNSLRFVQFVLMITKEFEIKFEFTIIQDFKTIPQLCDYIEESVKSGFAASPEIPPIQNVMKLLSGLAPLRSDTQNMSPRKILLTGATGFLGTYLLRDILENTDAHVTCIARGTSSTKAHERVKNKLRDFGLFKNEYSERFSTLCGNLSAVRFGLTKEEYIYIENEIDTIYHCAADLSFVKSYKNLEASNIHAVKYMLELCCAGCTKTYNHISSFGVLLDPGHPGPLDETSDVDYKYHNYPEYIITKKYGERLVIEAFSKGLRGRIFRPGRIMPDSLTGKNMNLDDEFLTYIYGNLEQDCFLDTSALLVDVTQVDICSLGIIILSLNEPDDGQKFHMVHPEKVTLNSCIWWLESILDIPVNKYTPEIWIDKVKDNPRLVGFLLLYKKYMEITDNFQTPLPEISSNYTARCMAKYGVYWPSPFESFKKFLPHLLKNMKEKHDV